MRIAKIKPNDIVNGNGIMVSVWTQGCPHHCKGCFNKETWSFNKGEEFTKQHKINILGMLDANGVSRNLSILGGEPLCPENIEGVLDLCNFIKLKRPQTIIYLWTGYTLDEYLENHHIDSLRNIDFMIDGKFIEEQKDIRLKLRGSKNQRIIDLKALRVL